MHTGPLAATVFAALILVASAAGAEDIQSVENIRATVVSFIKQRAEVSDAVSIEVSVDGIDPRLHLAACGVPLETFLPAGGRMAGNVSVGVRCNGPKPWSLYVPAEVRSFGNIVVATRPLTRGNVVRAGDYQMVRRDLSGLRGGYFFDPGKVVGKVVKRTINPGVPFQAHQLRAPALIKRGEKVTLVATTTGIQVRMNGEAVSDGAIGELIRVRNLSSKRVVQGVVTGAGFVEVRM